MAKLTKFNDDKYKLPDSWPRHILDLDSSSIPAACLLERRDPKRDDLRYNMTNFSRRTKNLHDPGIAAAEV
jgi:hypothetical protein